MKEVGEHGGRENSIKLGQVLVRAGRIKTEDLEAALKEQDKSQKRIGEILIEKGFIKPEELTHGLNVQSMLSSSGISPALSFGSVLEGKKSKEADSAIPKRRRPRSPVRSHLAILHQAPSLTITKDDIKAGYVILENGTRLAVKSNNRSGCLIVFRGLTWPFEEAYAFGFPHDVHITQDGASYHQSYKRNTHQIQLTYRFILSENARPGKYSWPLSIAIQPL